jgi:hypothetical protein
MTEVSEGEILRWSQRSQHNAQLYAQYVQVKQDSNTAWAARDGAAYTGLAVTRDRLRQEIQRRMIT